MDTTQKEVLVANMVDNLPTLRKRLNMTQAELADKIGIGRSSLIAIENKKRQMTWSTFLSLILIFIKNKDTDKLLNVMGIYTDELNEFIKRREQ